MVKHVLMNSSALEVVLRRDRVIIAASLVVLTLLAWFDVIWLAKDMEMGGMDMTGYRMIPAGQTLMMPASAPWQPVEFAYVFVMWVVMMIGMMTPSVAPMILVYARIGRQATGSRPFTSVAWFTGGYFLAWVAFSFVATSLQWALERAAWLTPMMASASNIVGGLLLILAGIYQWTRLKEVCLSQCQAPLGFILSHGGLQRTTAGSLKLGFRHGAHCLGCCWATMVLLFALGVMNLLWIAALAILVLLEKVVPLGRWIARAAGLAFFAGGVWMIFQPA
jgi:predicted metal-binding membrane protein